MRDHNQALCRKLRDHPLDYNFRYDDRASQGLQEALFRSLASDNNDHLHKLFSGNVPRGVGPWVLREAQGAVEGSEYTEAARGKACGHIFKSGEATYRCKTCTIDDTCVLCSKCFDASDHSGHMVHISISPGNSGCCDCGDAEAWRIPVNCAIHTADVSTAAGKRKEIPMLPDDLVGSIKTTIGRAIDYVCDVISCSPEQLRLHKTKESIEKDECESRLTSKWYERGDVIEPNPEYALILWNDEKHTVEEVQVQVARACRAPGAFGRQKANETNDMGRSVVTYSRDLYELLKIAKIIEDIKITVTIRSSRDTFREQMCGTIIEWLVDIAGCSVESDHNILRQTVCEEMLKLWRTGSEASNAAVGKSGIDDHEIDETIKEREYARAQAFHHGIIAAQLAAEDDDDSDDNTNDVDNDYGDDEAESQANEGDNDDDMELDLDIVTAADIDGDIEMRTHSEDDTEVDEATFAGYPPPPPPPPPPPQAFRPRVQDRTFSDSDSPDSLMQSRVVSMAGIEVPKTPFHQARKPHSRPPAYWLDHPDGYASNESVPLHEDLRQRVRLDWLILFDLRLWKKARIDLRDLYIGTVVTIPQFKRILALRFAGLYTVLAQLFLIADREHDHSIINLSLQMLTVPSITEEVVERGNFLTSLIAILYTFLTTRQVGHPWNVAVNATLAFDAGSVTNRRMYHFFMDLKYLFGSEYVQKKLRTEERYILQFLDLIRLPQGICPNVRAVGEHVEYETDAWISASLLTREINKLCRQFADSFKWRRVEDEVPLCRVFRATAKATIVNSIGAERKRFDQAEIKTDVKFKTLEAFEFDTDQWGHARLYQVVEFVVEKEPISFHHALHYTLSWLIDCGKSMSRDRMRNLLYFTSKELKEPPPFKVSIPEHDAESYLMALFDSPLRVCAWLAQMKAGMWVRNGLSLRHQMGTYKGVSQRDLAHHRDIFLLQTAMVTCDPSRVLASMIDRFGMDDWMRGNYRIRPGYEDSQLLDVAEDFIHLMIVLLGDRTSLHPIEDEPNPQSLAIRRDVAHILCFKPLSYSELCLKLAEKFQDLEDFQSILEEMTNFRAPEGLSDTGTFELKQEYLLNIDPYIAHYSKNQRDEAETAYRTWLAKKTGKAIADIVFEPKSRPIRSGVFKDLPRFTRTTLFAQIIYYSLAYALYAKEHTINIPITRVEAFQQVVLHLALAAVLEDNAEEADLTEELRFSFVHHALCKSATRGVSGLPTIFILLQRLYEVDEFKACQPKIRLILHRLQQKHPRTFASVTAAQAIPIDRLSTDSPMNLPGEDLELKKKQAMDRQAKVMAQFQQQQQTFLSNQGNIDWGKDDFSDLESTTTGPAEEQRKLWKYPTGNCILCQEETNDTRLFGTFAMMMDSNILRQTDLRDSDFVGEVLSTPSSLDRSADDIRPFGVAGQNRGKVRKLTSDGREIMAERQGLGKGFPLSHAIRGPVSTGCGHIMHYACFELYYGATQRRQSHQIARNHPERMEHKEFVCPLCKALGNTFLPIIWRGKEEVYPGVLQATLPFDAWLNSHIGHTVSRYQKQSLGEDAKSASNRFQELFVSYSSKAVIPPLANKLSHLIQSQVPLVQPQLGSPTSPQQLIRAQMSSFFSPDEPFSVTPPSHPVAADFHAMGELLSIYNRVRETIKVNRLSSRFPYPVKPPATDELTNTDTLAKALGFSISATEIAQRGIESEPGCTLLNKIPSLTLTHLRILSETASSYIAIGGLRNSGANASVPEFAETQKRQLLQLFAGHPQVDRSEEMDAWSRCGLPSALAQDPFVLLAEYSIFLVPSLDIDIHHIVRLCYLMEVVKVAFALFLFQYKLEDWPTVDRKSSPSQQGLQDFDAFLRYIMKLANPHYNVTSGLSVRMVTQFYSAVSTYALTFLRKAAILLHVRFGVDFPHTGFSEIDDAELSRLTKALNLPSLDGMFSSLGKDVNKGGSSVLQSIAAGWVRHWSWCCEKKPLQLAAQTGIRPSHPAIFELIGLPKHYDILTDETMRRRCPTTGKELVDPALCLFCGDIFCSQASCCMKDKLGGCSQHLKKYVPSCSAIAFSGTDQ
ncbi:MAG: hypothetical protein LQ347_001691 [Umbilicaria vellea]|nr:MAG: hypothetical protein LQ347_001691 [Umbilicaria vellea]